MTVTIGTRRAPRPKPADSNGPTGGRPHDLPAASALPPTSSSASLPPYPRTTLRPPTLGGGDRTFMLARAFAPAPGQGIHAPPPRFVTCADALGSGRRQPQDRGSHAGTFGPPRHQYPVRWPSPGATPPSGGTDRPAHHSRMRLFITVTGRRHGGGQPPGQ